MFIKPDYNIGKVYELPAQELKAQGIKVILLDLDSTVMISKTGKYLPETLEWFEQMQKDFKLAIVSNNKNPEYIENAQKITPFLVVGDAKKPRTDGIRNALKILEEKPECAVMVGDRPLTDILAGKFAKTKTILVKSLGYERESKFVHFVRWLERLFIRRF
ncbi:YqeG family HAD IIIA-type phosphatase [bacterium]|nr:YqeG family HAD IIIA-type phosphatase [bacterium]